MTSNQRYTKTAYLVLCSLFAALTAICSYITIPLPFTPIPVNLGTLGVFLTGGLLGRKYGTVSIAVYIFMGAVGLPVFAGFQGGIGILAGPTGGFIIGYLAAAFIAGTINTPKAKSRLALCMATLGLGTLACYFLGTLWFMVLMGTGLWPSLMACVIPFIPGDIIKIIAGAFLIKRLKPLKGV